MPFAQAIPNELPYSFTEDIKTSAENFTFSLASKNGTDDWGFKASSLIVGTHNVMKGAQKPPLLKAIKFSLQRFIQIKYAGQHNDPKMCD